MLLSTIFPKCIHYCSDHFIRTGRTVVESAAITICLKLRWPPKHPEHTDMKEWVGGGWNAEKFSVECVNSNFKKLKA